MSVKYTIDPGQRSKAAGIWIILVIIIGALVLTVAYYQRNIDYQYQTNETASEFINTEVFEKIPYHLVTIAIVVLLVVVAWGLGRKPEEVVPTPGEQVSE